MKRVKILLTIPDEKSYGPCTMVLDTIRVGYPDAFVEVYLNPNKARSMKNCDLLCDAAVRATKQDCRVAHLNDYTRHGEWIKRMVEAHASDLGDQGPLIIVDGDVMFHKSCEGWEFGSALMAGYFVPEIWNDFAICRSYSRLHTSHLWFTAPREMLRLVRLRVPAPFEELGEHCPLDIFNPCIKVVDGKPKFWDTTCVAYQLLGGFKFGPEHLDCYDHLNSASCREVMLQRLAPHRGQALEYAHTVGYKDAALLKRELWAAQNSYYSEKSKQLQ